MDEYTPCKRKDPTAQEAVGNVMRLMHTPRKKPNKYHARKTMVYGRTFDSKREAEIYLELLAMKSAGKIVRIVLQPSYTLLKEFKDNTGKKQKPIIYTPDFLITYTDRHSEVIEVKGVQTRDYILRKKLFLYMMRDTDIIFREVR
ncbi:DUF1064 domain-containing protein [uncultured Selenomonas sp.]|uniref:DUF1064 domain-containing protein n=1 Tax=uncultured Selenomonas sp. TaxID=159275 RepID=UPI0028D0B284|nr:DUF1064 domain-containing protein [uncultured Selenomonas sp.]